MDNTLWDLKKSLDTSSTNGNNVLAPVILSKIISEWFRIQPVIRNIIKRVPAATNTYTWDTVTDPGAAEYNTDGGTLSTFDAKFRQDVASMSYLYSTGYISNPAILADQELVNIVDMRVGQASKALLRKENSGIFNGDPNNSTNPGIKSKLAAGSTFSVIGAGATATRLMFSNMVMALQSQGYDLTNSVFVVSPNVYAVAKEAAFNNVRFMGVEGDVTIGYALSPSKALSISGVPVIMDPQAATFVGVTSENLVVVPGTSNKTWTFAHGNVLPGSGNDQAGTAFAAPTFTGSGGLFTITTPASGGNSQVTFASAPTTPAATYTYAQDNVYLLSLDPTDLVIAEQLPPHMDDNLANPVNLDAIPFRVKEYCLTVVRNPNAHVLASNVVVPSVALF